MGASPQELGHEIERYSTVRPDPSRPPKYTPEPKQPAEPKQPENPSNREPTRHSFRPSSSSPENSSERAPTPMTRSASWPSTSTTEEPGTRMHTEEQIRQYEEKHGPGSYQRMLRSANRWATLTMIGWGILAVVFVAVLLLLAIWGSTYDI
jgi:hypothetical protein